MIMDISIELILTTARRSGDKNQPIKLKKQKHFLFSYSGPNPDEPCVFPFKYLGEESDKCLTNTFSGAVYGVEVNLAYSHTIDLLTDIVVVWFWWWVV